jgi:hypothetical protein
MPDVVVLMRTGVAGIAHLLSCLPGPWLRSLYVVGINCVPHRVKRQQIDAMAHRIKHQPIDGVAVLLLRRLIAGKQ